MKRNFDSDQLLEHPGIALTNELPGEMNNSVPNPECCNRPHALCKKCRIAAGIDKTKRTHYLGRSIGIANDFSDAEPLVTPEMFGHYESQR